MAEPRLVLDSGGLSALAEGDPRALAWAYRATQRRMLIGIPAPVLAETLTGRASDARIHRVIPSPTLVIDTTAAIAREAGRLRFRARRPDATIDAIVVATAAAYPHSIVLTSDLDDLRRLAEETPRADLAVRAVHAPP